MASSSAELATAPGWDAHVHVFDANAPVRAGHYVPATRTIEEIESRAAAQGVGHLVLVQPSVYGTDNSLLLDGLKRDPGRHRGVVVVDGGIEDAELDRMHALGVRGVRFNRMSPVGNDDGAIHSLAPRLAQRGWHAQWYVAARDLPRLVRLQKASGLVFVLDHVGGITAASGEDEWQALAQLAHAGAWIKLSGWYRLGLAGPWTGVTPVLQRVRALFEDRMVWGSDWPHTSLATAPAYENLIEPLRGAFGDALTTAVLRDFPRRLYGPIIPTNTKAGPSC